MRIFFRADGNKVIGWGHVMRSLAIASAAYNDGVECFFICADSKMKALIESKGFQVFVLNTEYTIMIDEKNDLVKLLKTYKPDYLFVDSYYVSDEYFSIINGFTSVVYIDDVYAFPYNVNYLINYNIDASEQMYYELYQNKEMPYLMIGPKYTPLRSEFKFRSSKTRERVSDVFVSTGGSDKLRLVLNIINELLSTKELTYDIKYHFILGGGEYEKKEIYDLAQNNDWLILYENVNNIADIMCSCDIAISAAGNTLYELCACGIPTITYVLADNQIGSAEEFERRGIMLNAGDIRRLEYRCDEIIKYLKILIGDKKKRHVLSKKMNDIVDGNGAINIIKGLISK